MAVIKLNHRELKSRRFNLLTRALGGREEIALGVLVHLWLRAVGAKALTFPTKQKCDYIICPLSEVERVYHVLVLAQYLEVEGDQTRVLDTQPWIEGSARRHARAVKASAKSREVRAKKKRAVRKKEQGVVAERALALPDPAITETQLASRACWEAYSGAYTQAFGTAPVRNAKVNALIKQFVTRIPHTDAPHVLKFYVGHRNGFYAQRMYALDLAVKDAESLHTQWKTNRQVTRATMERFEQNEKARAALEEGVIF